MKNDNSTIEKLIAILDKKQIGDFIKKECSNDRQFRDRFLALGTGTLFTPTPSSYSNRINELITAYLGRYGYIEYHSTFGFYSAVSRILEEADEAMENKKWDVVFALLSGFADSAEEILNCGDDSNGNLGSIISDCFEKWNILTQQKLPHEIESKIFNFVLTRFKNKDLDGWDWKWDWMEIAIKLANTQERQNSVFAALDEIKPTGDNWNSKYAYNKARSYRVKLMARCGTPEEQRKFMYDNVDNSDFRKQLLQMAWDEGDLDEVLKLAQQGIIADARYAGLVNDWKTWEMDVYRKKNDVDNILRLARYFFFNGNLWRNKDYSYTNMYSLIKSNVSKEDWTKWRDSLIEEAIDKQNRNILTYIFTQEEMWDRYINYIKKNPDQYILEDTPKAVRNLYQDEFIKLYGNCARHHFQNASNRDAYQDGANMLRKLIEYGGKKEADVIIEEQKARRPRRPALIEELSKIK